MSNVTEIYLTLIRSGLSPQEAYEQFHPLVSRLGDEALQELGQARDEAQLRWQNFQAEFLAWLRQFPPGASQDEELISVTKAEKEYGIPRATLTLACREKEIQAKKSGGAWQMVKSSLEAWLRARGKSIEQQSFN